jgi:hypothetical protein
MNNNNNNKNNKIIVLSLAIAFLGSLLVLMLITTQQYQSSNAIQYGSYPSSDEEEVEQFSESQLEEYTSKCIELDKKGFVDRLQFQDPTLWLMCIQLILEEEQQQK